MSIIRVAQRHRFTVVDRRAISDNALSFRARGVLVWLLDKPDNWRINSDAIADDTPEGREAVRTAMRELRERGYLVKRPMCGGGSEWVLYEVPPPPAERPESRLSAGAERPETRAPRNPNAQKPVAIEKTDSPKTVGTNPPQSPPNHQRAAALAGEEDHQEPQGRPRRPPGATPMQVAHAVALRRFTRQPPGAVVTPEAWMGKVRAQVIADNGADIARYLAAGRSVDSIANELDPDGRPAPYRAWSPDDHGPAGPPPPGWRTVDALQRLSATQEASR